MNPAIQEAFTVQFSSDVTRVLECTDSIGTIKFTIDGDPDGNNGVCLEHHPVGWPRGPRYDLAFKSALMYLESCGYKVEIFGA
jgi:hypothetical protein